MLFLMTLFGLGEIIVSLSHRNDALCMLMGRLDHYLSQNVGFREAMKEKLGLYMVVSM